MADIPVQSQSGSPSFQAAAAGGDSFENNGSVFIRTTGPGGGYTLRFLNARDCDFGDHGDLDEVVPDANPNDTGKFSTFRFNVNGRVTVTYLPDETGIQIQALAC